MLIPQGVTGEDLSIIILEYIALSAILAGVLQVLAGLARLGKFIRLVPQPAMYGFVNGLAIVIALAQFKFFAGEGVVMYAIVGITMVIMYILPRFTKIFPAGLFAIVLITLVVYFMKLDTKTVGDLADFV